MGVWGGWGVPTHTCTCMCMHAHMHTHAHIHVKHDNFNCKWLPRLDFWGNPGIPYDVICMHVCACACMCMGVGGTLPPPHIPSTHPHPHRGTPGVSKNSITLELIEIFQFSVETLPPMGGCMVWWNGGLMGWFRSNH